MAKPDILMFMTDQHTPYYSGWYGNNVDTPNLDQLVENGTAFDEAYTVCPLCVPSRAAMLTAKRPAETGIFTLSDAIPDMTPTFLHHLVKEGYETVLVGRMHFVGADQRHGFTKRIFPDCTTITWNRQDMTNQRGVYESAYGGYKNTNVVGGGKSSSSYYDLRVIETALDYLSMPHEKPQFICVSIYSPHHPYVGPAELFEKYRVKVRLPESFEDEMAADTWKNQKRNHVSPELALDIQAAYCAMVEEMDFRMGMVHSAFQEYCRTLNHDHLFIYTSDHGDNIGDHRTLGKNNFFEKSAKIPMIFSGTGVEKNVRIKDAVSIMDLGPTVLEYIGAEPMHQVDGVSVCSSLQNKPFNEHAVYGEYINNYDKDEKYCFMLKEKQYKYLCFSAEDTELLYDTIKDPEERHNLIDELPETAQHMRRLAGEYRKDEQAVRVDLYHKQNYQLWKAYESATGVPYMDALFSEEVPQEYLSSPEILSSYCTKL